MKKLNDKQKAAVEEEVERRLAGTTESRDWYMTQYLRLTAECSKLRRKLLYRALVGNAVATEHETIAIINAGLEHLPLWGGSKVVSIFHHSLSFTNGNPVRVVSVLFECFGTGEQQTIRLEGNGLEWKLKPIEP